MNTPFSFSWSASAGYSFGAITAPTAAAIVAAIEAALVVAVPEVRGDEADENGVVTFDAVVKLDGVEIVEAPVWRLVGWIAPGASCDLDGSGLSTWGDSRSWTEWSVCRSDGQSPNGDAELKSAVEGWLVAAATAYHAAVMADPSTDDDEAALDAAIDLLAEVEEYSCDLDADVEIAEPSADDVFAALDATDEFTALRAGKMAGCPVVAIEGEFVAHPDAADIQRLMDERLPAVAKAILANIAPADDDRY